MNTSMRAVVLATTMLLPACDTLIDKSKFNITSEQMNRISRIDVIDRDEFKIDMPEYLKQQFSKLDQKLAAQNLIINPASSLCSPNVTLSVSSIAAQTYGAALAGDRVIAVSLATTVAGVPGQLEKIDRAGETELGFANFEAFRRNISDSVSAKEQGIILPGVNNNTSSDTLFDGVVWTPGLQAAVKAGRNGGPLDSPVLAYLGAYYRGKFVDRFGNSIVKPSLKNGIDDGTISNFARILLEVGIDSVKPREPSLKDSSGTYYPKNVEPTFHKVFGNDQLISGDGKGGISAAESRLIEAGSNLIAEQGLTFFSGLLEFLSSVNIGFIIAPNFSVGSNHTLKSVVRSVIETSLRRGAQRGLYCLVEKYNLDSVASVIRE